MEEKKKTVSPASAYKMEFQKDNYERINLSIKAGQKDIIKKASEKAGYKSLNDFCVDAIYEKAKLPKPEMKPKGRKGKPKAEDSTCST